jgi:hypothetical protein
MTLYPARHHSVLGTPTVYRLPSTVRAGASAIARDHGSIALHARYAPTKGHLFFPYVRPRIAPRKGDLTQNCPSFILPKRVSERATQTLT